MSLGNPIPDVFGGTACDGQATGFFSIVGTGLFSFSSIDFKSLNGDLDYTIEGLVGGSPVWSQGGSIAPPGGFAFITVGSLTNTPVDALRLQLTALGTSFNFDNIALAGGLVPEPAGMVLAMTALMLMGRGRRRRG